MSDKDQVVDLYNRSALMGKKLAGKGGLRASFKSYKESEKENKKLKANSETDELTGIANKRRFNKDIKRVHDEFERGIENYAVMYLDVDHFKHVNDSYGHAKGDDLLKEISRILVDSVRDSDTVYRTGGDEFAILLEGFNADSLEKIKEKFANRLGENMSELIQTPEFAGVDLSIGFVTPNDGEHYKSVLERADSLMYLSKKEKGNNR